MTAPTVTDCGDSSIRITSGADTAEARWVEVHRIAAALDGIDCAGIYGAIATYDAVLVEFDCAVIDHDQVRSVLDGLDTRRPVLARAPREFEIPVVYGGEYGPDLGIVADTLGLTETEVVALHCAVPLTMRCYGSPGGAPMLDGPAFGMSIPRRSSPRPSVPSGAVAVAGHQAVISARPAPGGWQVLGRTPITLVDIASDPISPYAPGDSFRFHPIIASEWDDHRG
ncbi:carboxyltransferase domain-containing protein [Rhodococcus sp. IEGM 1381]|uniref:5-oxoprolinase subunit B family protein n=1 Tax=Rhodococcus sp. IEGM 1381 TaxID=3047085 RepID=UPI0024B69A74|nr:carboxyltransferase domain-containing protein [Rhodococcus sp. IEGM 1381]MDI9897141.1 carboxyltransferase domain-containing protein [Rhodococcus sp. IEGM 1381]